MEHTMVGVFDSEQEARAVRQELVACGIEGDRVHLRAGTTDDVPGARTDEARGEPRHKGFWASLFGMDEDEDDDHVGQYREAVRRGSCVVVIDAIDDDSIDEASQIMSRHGAIDIDARTEGWRERGWSGYDESAPALSADELSRERSFTTGTQAREARDTQRIPVVEEQLEVGKRVIDRGGVRIHARTSERPVEEDVTLREERARVERHPVDRPATEAEQARAFRDATVEVRETAEEAVVSKSARVVEEVEIGKEASQRTQKVKDKVRRTDVQVENLGEGEARSAMATAQPAAGASPRADGDLDVDDLNHMLRDELSAMETYRQALDRNRGEYGQDARFGQLEQMMRDHEQACSQLRAMIRQLGGSESQDSGAWGTWANTVMGTARLFGDTAALKALKEGEESGIKDYEDMLHDHAPSPEMQRVLASIVEQERRHVAQLDRLMEAA